MSRPLSFLLLIATLLAVGWWLWTRENPHTVALVARSAATRELAEYLAKRFPGERALVVSNPFVRGKGVSGEILAMEEAGIRGLKGGTESRLAIEVVAYPELRPAARTDPRSVFIEGESTTPLSFLVSDEAFDKLAQAHPSCSILISLIGLPLGLDQVRCWTDEGPPRFALLLPDLRIIGDGAAVKQAMQRGKLVAFILAKPDALQPSAPGAPGNKGRKQEFILVTPDNVDQVLETWPLLFQQPRY